MKRIIVLILFLLLSLLSCSPIDTTIQQGQPVYIYPLYSWNGTAWQQVGFGNFSFDSSNATNWNTAYLWGNHESGFTMNGGINTNNQGFYTGDYAFNVYSNASEKGMYFINYSNGDRGSVFKTLHNSSSPANGDWVFLQDNIARNSDAIQFEAELKIVKVDDVAAGSMDSSEYYYLFNNGSQNLAMYLTGDGTLYLDVGTSIFDDKDDALVLKRAISMDDKTELLDMKILIPKIDKNGNIVKDEYMISQKDIIRLLAGAAYQNRDKIDALELRIKNLEAKVK